MSFDRRQYHELTDAEIERLGDALVGALTTELDALGVAGADKAQDWTLARRIRETVAGSFPEIRERIRADDRAKARPDA